MLEKLTASMTGGDRVKTKTSWAGSNSSKAFLLRGCVEGTVREHVRVVHGEGIRGRCVRGEGIQGRCVSAK